MAAAVASVNLPTCVKHATYFVCSITHTWLQVRPYDATEVQQALDHATHLLPKLGLQQMSNIVGALAAAGHYDSTFMQRLGDAAAARLRATPRLMQHTQGLQAFRIICWLAVGFSRLGVLHVDLLEQIALYGELPCVMALQHTPVTAGSCSQKCMADMPWHRYSPLVSLKTNPQG